MIKKICFILSFWICYSNIQAQSSPDYNGGMKIKLNEDGSKYIRFITWAQVQATYEINDANTDAALNFNLRRARILTYSQISKDFLVLAHFGLNNLNASAMSPVGKGDGAQLFFHDVWAQYNVHKNHTIGAGLHYFNGISRLNSQGTLNMMTLDNNRQSWSTLGLSDQFARHLGVFAKGNIKKFQYRVAVNNAIVNSLDTRDLTTNVGTTIYAGKKELGSKKAGLTYAGYFEYNIFDEESNFLPFKVGTYLGKKKILNVGAGFFIHPNGSVIMDSLGVKTGNLVNLIGVDVFYDAPIGKKGHSVTAYGAFQSNNYGKKYLFNAYGTGTLTYAHVGFGIPTKKEKVKFQPYVSYALNTYSATKTGKFFYDSRNVMGVGVNAFLNGDNSKLTLEYQNTQFALPNLVCLHYKV